MAQAMKYQQTTIPVDKSVAEIAELIRKYGGSRFEQLWDEDGEVQGIRFAIRHESIGELPVSLTARTAEIERVLAEAGYAKGRSADDRTKRAQKIASQSRRIAWRHIKDLTEQLLLAVSLGLRSLPAAFMADIEAFDEESGQTVTMYEFFESRARIEDSGRGVRLQAAGESEAIELAPENQQT